MFGRYRIRGVLEEGGMGRLYVAERTGIEGFTKVVALKRILPHLAHDPKLRDMFIAEARVAARLDHPDIVTTFELGEVDGNYFMSMEYLPGEDLAKILSKCTATQPMPIEIAATLAQRVAEGLHYAHELNDDNGRPAMLVHRDVNPCNIVVTYYGAVKLLDFGVAKEATASSTTFSGVFRGNYAYCAPEQIEGAELDRRTDVFCLGIVLWECVTGQRLFGGGTDVRNIDAVRSKRIEPPGTLRAGVPPELDAIVMRCLSRDPARRYQMASELSSALRQFLLAWEHNPTEQSIGAWLESQFGAERCARKKAIGQGTEIEAALAFLQLGTGGPVVSGSDRQIPPASQQATEGAREAKPRVLWSTSIRRTPGTPRGVSATPVPPLTALTLGPEGPPSERRSAMSSIAQPGAPPLPGASRMASAPIATPAELPDRLTSPDAQAMASVMPTPGDRRGRTARRSRKLAWGGTALLGVVVVAIGAAAGLGRAGLRNVATPATSPQFGSVEVRSEPSGAQIMIDGSPTGLSTPAVLAGLPLDRSVRLELSKAGYAAATLMVEPRRGQRTPRSVQLVQTTAGLRFVGLPPRASIFLDGVQVDSDGIVEATVGRHQLRVEARSRVIHAQDIDARPGEQAIVIQHGKSSP